MGTTWTEYPTGGSSAALSLEDVGRVSLLHKREDEKTHESKEDAQKTEAFISSTIQPSACLSPFPGKIPKEVSLIFFFLDKEHSFISKLTDNSHSLNFPEWAKPQRH